MKKAMVIMNGSFANHAIITSAVNLAKHDKTILHAIFLQHDTKTLESDYLYPNDLALTQNRLTGKSIEEENAALVNANIWLFIDVCEQQKVSYIIEPDTHLTLKDLIGYSAFYDYIIADAQSNLEQYRLSDLLADAHCPIFLTSARINQVKRIILAYDGSYSSTYALKMYHYIFPEWSSVDTTLLFIATEKSSTLPQEDKVKSMVTHYFSSPNIKILQGPFQDSFIKFIKESEEDCLVVMGAYGRSNFSRIIHKSLADMVIEKTQAALFIVHE
jgi:hypothetical protein